ncbi:hypothetical protein ACF1GW_09655 [Streptomyces achromogenes]|uniref:hypothetical protein n=1 Tax=Streptomyces achromogenes TaxID=67255 RepID=UPI0037024678
MKTSDMKTSAVKWLSPRAFRLWRNVRLGGLLPGGLEDAAWRGRAAGRDTAYADLMYSSGLRHRWGWDGPEDPQALRLPGATDRAQALYGAVAVTAPGLREAAGRLPKRVRQPVGVHLRGWDVSGEQLRDCRPGKTA